MKLIINTATTYKGGGVQVASSFIDECRNFSSNEYHIILGEGISGIIDVESFPANFSFYKIPYRPAQRVFSFKDQAAFMKGIEKKIKPDCVFTTSGPAYWRPKVPHLMGFNLPHYMYPDSPFFSRIGKLARLKWKLKGKVINYFTRHDADAYVVQTDDVKDRLKNWIKKDKVYTVTNTYGSQYNFPPSGIRFLPDKKEGEYRLLMLSSYYAHKNFEIINEILNLCNDDEKKMIRFVLTLPDNSYNEIIQHQNREFVYNTRPVKPAACPQLYSECDAVFMPSLLECFSATYAEAMKMEKPIITSNLGFAHTVCGDAALYFNPADAKDAKNKIITLFDNEDIKAGLVKKGKKEMTKFNTSQERAVKFLNLCQNLIN